MQFYREHSTFFRDRQAIQKAIARYGYVCANRHWFPSVQFIYEEITKVLDSTLKHKADIRYLPLYLEHAIDAAVRLRSEELALEAKKIENIFARAVPKQFVVKVEPKPVEVLAHLYKSLNKPRRKKCGEQRQLKLG